MWFRKNIKVLCTGCGFLGWQSRTPDDELIPGQLLEFNQYSRDRFQFGKSGGQEPDYETQTLSRIHCLRDQWFLSQVKQGRGRDPDTIRQPSKCPYYIKYNPAYSPEEHKELKRDAETRRTIRNATLLGAAIGASSAIIAQLLYVFLTAPH